MCMLMIDFVLSCHKEYINGERDISMGKPIKNRRKDTTAWVCSRGLQDSLAFDMFVVHWVTIHTRPASRTYACVVFYTKTSQRN